MTNILAAVIPVLLPLIVTGLTSATKRLPVFDLSEETRKIVVRLIAAVFSVVMASIYFMLGGDPVSETSISELVLAALLFLGSVGGHHLLKKD